MISREAVSRSMPRADALPEIAFEPLTFEIDGSPDLIGERELGRYFRTETDEVEALVEEHRSEAS